MVNDRHLYLTGWPLLLLLDGLAVLRNEAHRSEVALWEDTVCNSPLKARPYNNLGYAYFLAGNPAKVQQAYLTAVKLNHDCWLAENNLARLHENKE